MKVIIEEENLFFFSNTVKKEIEFSPDEHAIKQTLLEFFVIFHAIKSTSNY